MSTTMKSTFGHVNWTQFCDQTVVFVFASSLYAAILYNTGTNSTLVAGIAGFAIVVGAIIWGYLSKAQWRTTILTVLFIAVVLCAFGYLREFSYDGLNYHVATPLMLDHRLNGVTGSHAPSGAFWANHYPKAFEYFAYTAKVLTTHFNSGKSFTLLLSVPALSALVQLFQTAGISRRTALVASAACIYNPVALGQWATFYVDAAHYYCWTIFSVNFLFALKSRTYSKVQLGIALVLLIGSKLTGPVFAAISILVFFVAAFIGGEKRDFFWKYKGVFGQLAIWSIVAVAVVGYSPYVENVAAGKHVFYPVLGKDKVDVMKRQASTHFLAMNPLHRLFLSYFSMPSDCEACEESEPTFVPSPTHVRAAIGALHTADTRFGGFGPFFGFMLISCLASFFWRRKHADVVKLYLLATLVIVLAHPQSWWARYVPMFYVVPFLVTAGFSSNQRLFHIVIALGIMNSVLAGASVGRYMILRQAYYQHAVTVVRTVCNQRQVALTPSEMNWEANLRDDHLDVATNNDPPKPECPVDFDLMMIMKR